MSSDSSPAVQEPDVSADAGQPRGFGVCLARHRWMTAEAFNETFALGDLLPGPNIVNLPMVPADGPLAYSVSRLISRSTRPRLFPCRSD